MTEHHYDKSSSKQDYETPADFLDACAARFGALEVDLACRDDNRKAPIGLSRPLHDSLMMPWGELYPDAVMWLNPPFKDIEPWAAKCAEEALKLRRGRILLLTPAAIGANWYASHCYRKAKTIGLNGRLKFVGSVDYYPKDCMLNVFGGDHGFEVWRWRGGEARVRGVALPKPANVRKLRAPKASASSRTIDLEEHLEQVEAP